MKKQKRNKNDTVQMTVDWKFQKLKNMIALFYNVKL